jgi:arylsulfatase A-like enzyme
MILHLAAAALQSQAVKPNIVLIMADDAGYADFGFMGSKQIKTPHLDTLAYDGAIFSQGYVSSPVCSPSRAGMLTGRYQQRFGHEYNILGMLKGYDPEFYGTDVNEQMIPDYLSELGYVTGCFGKWHLGKADQFFPTERGFKEFWGFRGGSRDYFKPSTGERKIESSYETPEPVTYLTDDIGRETVDFINRHADEPYFAFLSFNAPHSPMQAKPEDIARFEHIENKRRRIYAAMMYAMDVQIGEVVKAVEATGKADSTIIVFLSDNGGPTSHNGSINAPLNGQKASVLEGGSRVPFIVHWPAQIKKRTRVDSVVSSLDLLPTFLDAAGQAAPAKLDGMSLGPLFTGNTDSFAGRSLFWRLGEMAALRSGDYKLLRVADRPPMLFDLASDISEQHDLALERPGIVRRLMADLWDWETGLGHPFWTTGAAWMDSKLKYYDLEYELEQPGG